MSNQTITLTFGDQAENHAGMQKIGKLASEGFTYQDLKEAEKKFLEAGYECELIDLTQALPYDTDQVEAAYLLVIRKGVDYFLSSLDKNSDDLLEEQETLEPDTKAFMRGRVVNKRARYNLCFGEESQEPDYEAKKGRIISYFDVPLLNYLRENLPSVIGKKAENLVVEGNYYYDVNKCYIGPHGDSERRKVIAVRLGYSFPLYYQWYHQSKKVGERIKLTLDHGDMYIMSEKAVGYDWKRRKIPTLRHAAGSEKSLKLT